MGKQGLIQKLALQQKLSPQQILLMKMLQIPTVALEQRIKQEIEENPALDDVSDFDETDQSPDSDDDFQNEMDNGDSDEFDLKDYLTDDDIPGYKLNANNYSPDDEKREIPYSSGKTFHDLLISQLGLRNLTEKQLTIAATIIGNLDESGYLRRDVNAMVDDLSFSQNLTATPDEIEDVLATIQELDPPGVGARDLKECLLVQLKRKQADFPEKDFHLPILIIQRYFDEFAKKHYEKLHAAPKFRMTSSDKPLTSS